MNADFEKATLGEKVADFVTSVRLVLITIGVVLVLAIAGIGTFVYPDGYTLEDNKLSKSTTAIKNNNRFILLSN